jgi:glutathionylspermidine synthase
VQRESIAPRADWREKVEELGFTFHTMYGEPYWVEEACYRFSESQVDELEDATAELHDMCMQAVRRVIAEKLYDRLAIPPAFHGYIEHVWNRGDPEIFGRLDLRYDGTSPPKLLEYNADTPTALYEASVVQWHWLQEVKPDADQFNSIHEKLIDVWAGLKQRMGADRIIYFTCAQEEPEDFGTTEYMRDTCQQAGIATKTIDIAEIGWNELGFVDLDNAPIYVLFKLYPWEWLAREEFGRHLTEDLIALIEPAWKMVLSNKGILPILWEMFPDHPNLLPSYTSPEPLGTTYVRKPLLSREGANVSIVSPEGTVEQMGRYGAEGYVYQENAPLPTFDGWHAVVGSWVIGGQPAGIGLREDRSPITRNLSRFVPHYMG